MVCQCASLRLVCVSASPFLLPSGVLLLVAWWERPAMVRGSPRDLWLTCWLAEFWIIQL